MPSTSRGYPYPSGSDDVDIPGDIQALADAVNTDVGTIATTTPSAPVLQTLADAAGDLAVGSAADTFGRLALGTDNYALTVNTGGAGVAKVGWEDPTANPLTSAALALKVDDATVGNLLTANMASFEDGTTKWINAGGSPTITNDATYARVGTRSCKLVTNGTGSNLAWQEAAPHVTPVTPGLTYTGSFYTRTDTAGELVRALMYCYQSDGTTATSTKNLNYGPAAIVSTTGWQRFTVTVTVPSDAAFGVLLWQRIAGSNTASHWLDCAGVWLGTGGEWAAPGSPIPGTTPELASAQSSAVNMLTSQYTDTVASWTGTSATMTASTAAAARYGASTGGIVLTATSATAGQAATDAPTAGAKEHPAVPGETYTFTGYAKLGSGVRYGYAQIQWYADAVYLSSTTALNTHLSTAGWSRVVATGTAPDTANAMRLVIFAPGVAAMGSAIGDVIYYSGMTLNRGVGGDSASPGAPVLGTMPTEAAVKLQVGNMLTPQEATGGDFYGDASGYIPTNCTLASSTAQYDRGTRSLELTASAAAAMSIYPGTGGGNGHPATPGVPYTAYFRVRNGTYTGQWYGRLYFYTAAMGTATGSPFTGSVSTTVSSSGWTTVRHTYVAPADAAWVMPYLVSSTAPVVGETAYVDSIGVWQGAGGEWAYPGTPIPGLGQYTDENIGRRTFVWDQVNGRFQLAYGDTGWRSVTPENSWTVNNMFLRRTGNVCELTTTVLNGAAATTAVFYTLPTGFRPYNINTWYVAAAGTGATTHSFLNNTGALTMSGTYTGVTTARVSAVWTTDQSWPTSLPGTASGTIPA